MKWPSQVRQLHFPSILMAGRNVLENKPGFDPQLLDILACPLSKKPLRYDPTSNELVSDDIGVAYPIVEGIPNLNPIHGRILNKDATQDKGGHSSDR